MSIGADGKHTRGTSNGNSRGNTRDRRRRREWIVRTYRADVDLLPILITAPTGERREILITVPLGEGKPACRCYRCGRLLTVDTVEIDRIFPGRDGGLYGTPFQDAARQATNVRPACGGVGGCNQITGGALASRKGKKA